DVRREDDVLDVPQRAVWRQRLVFEDIETGAGDPAFGDSPDEIRFDDHATTRDVDQYRRRLHGTKLWFGDHASRLGRQWYAEHHVVARAQETVEVLRWHQFIGVAAGVRLRDGPSGGDDAAAERL